MNITLETYNNKLVMIMPLVDEVYQSASHVAQMLQHSDLEKAFAYFNVATVTVDVFDFCPAIEAQISHMIIGRRNGWTREAL
jgi:hypothetical protein